MILNVFTFCLLVENESFVNVTQLKLNKKKLNKKIQTWDFWLCLLQTNVQKKKMKVTSADQRCADGWWLQGTPSGGSGVGGGGGTLKATRGNGRRKLPGERGIPVHEEEVLTAARIRTQRAWSKAGLNKEKTDCHTGKLHVNPAKLHVCGGYNQKI